MAKPDSAYNHVGRSRVNRFYGDSIIRLFVVGYVDSSIDIHAGQFNSVLGHKKHVGLAPGTVCQGPKQLSLW